MKPFLWLPFLLYCQLANSQRSALTAELDTIEIFESADYYLKKSRDHANVDIDSMVYFSQQARRIAERIKADSLLTWTSLYLGIAHSSLGSYAEAAEEYYRGLAIADRYNDQIGRMEILNSIAIDLSYQGQYLEALSIFDQTIELAQGANDQKQLANSHLNRGMMMGYLGRDDDELTSYNVAAEIFLSIHDSLGYADALMNIGAVQVERENYKLALSLFDRVLIIYELADYKAAVAQTLQNYAETFMAMGSHQRALENIERSLEICQLNGLRQDELYSRDLLHKLYASTGDDRAAYRELVEYMSLENNLFNQEKTSQIQKLKTYYESEQKEHVIELLQVQNDLTQSRLVKQRFLVALLVLSIGFLFLTFLQSRRQMTLKNKVLSIEVNDLKERIRDALGSDQWNLKDAGQINDHLDDQLSNRELEILQMVLQDYKNSDIASKAYISINTVKFHLKNIYAKLGVANRNEARELLKEKVLRHKD